jgi:hypothetical protein
MISFTYRYKSRRANLRFDRTNLPKGIDKDIWLGYISKAVEGNSDTETARAAPGANLSALNLDNYIV